MKKVLKITGIVLLVIVLLLVIAPFAFRGKILEIVKNEANKMLNAKVDFKSVDLSFIRSFPHASVVLKDIYVAGIDEFENDTLFAANEVAATVNIKSFFGDTGYEISRIQLINGQINAIVLEDGKANWDIVKSDSTQIEEKTDTTATNFKLSLKKVLISNTNIAYTDYASNMSMELLGIDLELAGDMTADNTHIKTDLESKELSFIMDKIPYLSKAKLTTGIELDADLKNMKFVLIDSWLQLNEIKMKADGWVAMPEEEQMDMDLTLSAPDIQFKDVLSMIPAIYAKDFQDIKTSGEASLDASMKGTMKGEDFPAFDVKLIVANAMFQYPALPKSVTNIAVNAHITSPGGLLDNTVVDVSNVHFDLGGNPFNLNLKVTTPMSDPNIALAATGNLDLGMVKDVYPLEDMQLNGKLNANLTLNARMSSIEKEEYEKINANGTLIVSGMNVDMEGMDQVQINQANLAFSPKFVDLTAFSAQIGKNDIAANGKLENFIPYFLKDATLKGSLTVNSNYLNLNDFMTEDSGQATGEDAAIGIIEIPNNLDFNLTGNFKRVLFDNLDMTNVKGQIIVRNGKVEMKNLLMNALGGSLGVNGSYDTSVDPKQPQVALALDIKNVSFAQTFATFATIQQIAPIFESVLGNYSTSVQLKAPLGSDFMPVLTQLTAAGLLQSSDVEVKDVKALDAIAGALKNDKFKDIKLKDLKLPFSIANGRVKTQPFDVNMGGLGKMNLSGSTGLDQTIDYAGTINLADNSLTKGYVNNLNLKIGGTFTNPKVSVDAANLATQVISKVIEDVIGVDVSNLAEQADALRKQAQEAGDKLIAEAEKQGQKLIDEAKKTQNPLAKAAAVTAAEASAKKLKDEAKKQADKLNAEAENQIQKLKPASSEAEKTE